MKVSEYLDAVLAAQELADNSHELEELQTHREEVESVLRAHFAESSPTIRYGGSKAKGTLIRESYDLDIICYFPFDESAAGSTLKEIYENAQAALSETYCVEAKTSALRIRSKEESDVAPRDFHIDVIPGRFTDATKSDCYIHQSAGEKERLKTNLDVHLTHVRKSGAVDSIRMLKLWKVRNGITLKNFVFELVVIKLLSGKTTLPLWQQLETFWQELKDRVDPVTVEDPANPQGNDLSSIVREAWPALKSAAAAALTTIKTLGWSSIFGQVEEPDAKEKVRKLQAVAAAVITPTKPWYSGL